SSLSGEGSSADTNTLDPAGPNWYSLFASLRKKRREVKLTLRTEMATLRTSLSALESRVTALESAGPEASCPALPIIAQHTRQLTDLRLHIEDLDYRSRRHNIRVRGLRDAQNQEDLRVVLALLFNLILGRPSDARLRIDRVHRALHPRPMPSTPPRDIICCVQDFQTKDDIMRRARTVRSWQFEGQEVELFNDLSHITLQIRQALRPVTSALQSHQIRYWCQFPLALTARRGNAEATIRNNHLMSQSFWTHWGCLRSRYMIGQSAP
ncbi:Hypothetical predicted protein, partial [Pelobates cultripes]